MSMTLTLPRTVQGEPEVTAICCTSLAWLLRDLEGKDWWQWKEEIQNFLST